MLTPQPHRRRNDGPRVIALPIDGRVPVEGPAEHCRNALSILRYSMEHDAPLIGNGCPAIAVPITSLARMQARLEAAIEQMDGTQ